MAELEALFRHCFKTAYPGYRAQVATQRSLGTIADLADEVRAGEWTISDIEDTWTRIFPIWWRFVIDTSVRSNDPDRPDRFCAVSYLAEMHNYLRDHEHRLEEEATFGPFAPSALRHAVFSAYNEAGGIRDLVARDPKDAIRQLGAMADYLRDQGVSTAEGIRFIVRLTCHFGQGGREGTQFWTADYGNIGLNARACLSTARQGKRDVVVSRYAADCVREFAARISSQLHSNGKAARLISAEMDEAIRVATCITLGNGKGDPVELLAEKYGLGVEAPAE